MPTPYNGPMMLAVVVKFALIWALFGRMLYIAQKGE